MSEKIQSFSPDQLEDYLYQPLQPSDLGWLNGLAKKTISISDLDNIETSVYYGSTLLGPLSEPEEAAEVTAIRRAFFEDTLGWSDQDHPIHKSYQKFLARNHRLTPIDTVVAVQRVFDQFSIDGARVIEQNTSTLGYSAENIYDKLMNLHRQGLDLQYVIERESDLINISIASVNEKIENLENLGIDSIDAVHIHPHVLAYSIKNVQSTMELLTDFGIDAPSAATAQPAILGYNDKSIAAKIHHLSELGLETPRVIDQFPRLLTFSKDTIRSKMTNFRSLGIDAVQLVNTFPAALGGSIEGVRLKFALLERYDSFRKQPELLQNMKFVHDILVTPLTSLVAHSATEPEFSVALPNEAIRYMQQQRRTTPLERQQYVKERQNEISSTIGEQIAQRAFRHLGIKKIE